MKEERMKPEEWVERFAEELGGDPPSAAEIEAILELAATAAHASERTAAPVACWVAGRSGRSLEELRELAAGIGAG